MSEKCYVVVLRRGKPKVKRGRYEAENSFGFYGKSPFGIPSPVDVNSHFQTVSNLDRTDTPVFVVNPKTEMACSMGGVQCTDVQLSAKLRVAFEKRYAKALVLRVLDMTTLLIAMGCGAGLLFAGLTILSTFTGNPIVFGSPK